MSITYEECRRTFRQNLRRAIREYDGRVGIFDRIRVWKVLREPELADAVEEYAVELGVTRGVIPVASVGPEGTPAEGLLRSDWVAFLELLIESLPQILEFIAGIFNLFQSVDTVDEVLDLMRAEGLRQ